MTSIVLKSYLNVALNQYFQHLCHFTSNFNMLLKFLLICCLLPSLFCTQLVDLTDKTWQEMLNGQWMVEFYAPWCPACQQFKKPWSDFANAVSSKNVKVAAIDIDQYPSLSGRFRISALPTIYHVQDGVFRQFNGDRSLNALMKYIEKQEWKQTEPLSSYFAPNSILMSLVSSVFGLSVLVKDGYTLLHDQYAWPVWLVYTVFAIGIIILGIVLAFGALTIIDYFVTGSPKVPPSISSKDRDEAHDNESGKLLKSEQKDDDDDDDALESDENDSSERGSNVSDALADSDEGEMVTTDQTVRRRR